MRAPFCFSTFLLLLALSITTVRGESFPPPTLPIGTFTTIGSECTTDSDCVHANAICWPHSDGIRGPPRCACRFGQTWGASHMMCMHPPVNGTVVTIERTHPLLYREQRSAIALNIPVTAFPSAWKCDSKSRYCWAEDDRLQYVTSTSEDWWQITNTELATLAVGHVIWTCKSNFTYTPLNEDATTTVESRHGGIRSLRDQCSTCAENRLCGSLGDTICHSGVFAGCVCDSLWSGPTCTTHLLSQPSTRGAYLSTVSCNPLQRIGNSACGINQWCYHVEGSTTQGRCECAPNFVPATSASNQCNAVAGTLLAAGTRMGSETNNVQYASSAPSSIWWSPRPNVIHYGWVRNAVELSSHQWTPIFAVPPVYACTGSNYFYDPTGTNHCRGAVDVCGVGVDTSASNAATGVCVCATNFGLDPITGKCSVCTNGKLFPGCTTDRSTCDVSGCYSHGVCPGSQAEYDELTSNLARVPHFYLDPHDTGAFTSISTPPRCACSHLNTSFCASTSSGCITLTAGVASPFEPVAPLQGSAAAAWWIRRTSDPLCRCAEGFGGPTCEYDAALCADSVCGSGTPAHCVSTALGSECLCVVEEGVHAAYGPQCGMSAETCRIDRCNNRGSCILQNQGCTCDPNWGGGDCSEPICHHDMQLDSTRTACSCSRDLQGTFCESWVCNEFSRYELDGSCSCVGLWENDLVTGNCTQHSCGLKGVPLASNPDTCECVEGYIYLADRAAKCAASTCNGNGDVDKTTGLCACDWLMRGEFCHDTSVYNAAAFSALAGLAIIIALPGVWWCWKKRKEHLAGYPNRQQPRSWDRYDTSASRVSTYSDRQPLQPQQPQRARVMPPPPRQGPGVTNLPPLPARAHVSKGWY